MERIATLSLLLMCVCATGTYGKGDKLELAVYYESYNPESIDFFVHQLYPTWVKLNQYIELELIPFGLAEQIALEDGTYNFTCVNGRKECLADTLHACAIHKACHNRTTPFCATPRLGQAMDYIYCVMQAKNQKKASDKCAESAGLRRWGINKCTRGYIGNQLASTYTSDARSFAGPQIEYVPFIVINEVHNEKQQEEAQDNLTELVCRLIQDQCYPDTCLPDVCDCDY